MKKIMLKTIALTLMMTVGSLSFIQPRAEAMLAPSSTVKTSPPFDRSQDIKTIQTTLESKILRQKLHTLGLNDAEIQSRLSRLSDAEVHQLASQIRSVHPAGDGLIIGLLVVVVLVLLIIYLVKRI